jgi:dihydrofolate synthase/folylpolyglutamate synthase
MWRERLEVDQALFMERLAGRPAGLRRSLARAGALAPYLGIDLNAWSDRPERIVTVVGSKGKGTAAAFASAALAAAGLRVGTLTSPGLRSNRERIRVQGQAIAVPEYERLVRFVARTIDRVERRLPADGYLSPGGLFTLAALHHFEERRCDAVVLEAGMGGASDEVSLVTPGVVAITPIIGEHLGVLGDTVGEIAAEKAGVVRPRTAAVVAAEQRFAEAQAAVDAAAARHGCPVTWVDAQSCAGPWRRPGPTTCCEPAERRWTPPAGLSSLNAAVGLAAARRLLKLRNVPPPDGSTRDAVLGSVCLPGRLSHHRRGAQRWIVDCATNPDAVAAALGYLDSVMGRPTAVLTFIPRHRDAAPLLAALEGRPVTRVHGGPGSARPGGGATMRLELLDLDALGPRVLALGPVYFAGEVLAMLGIDCERIFTPPEGPSTGRPETARSGAARGDATTGGRANSF